MKRHLWLILTLLLVFSACARQPTNTLDFSLAVQELSASYSDSTGFSRADEDFVLTNFGSPEYVTDSAVYLSDKGEIGIFALSDTKHAEDMIKIIKTYLSLERESVVALSELYPADELSARLARFDNARVGAVGSTVYYYMLESDNSQTAQKLFGK